MFQTKIDEQTAERIRERAAQRGTTLKSLAQEYGVDPTALFTTIEPALCAFQSSISHNEW